MKTKKLITFGCIGIAGKAVSKEDQFIFLSFRLTGKTILNFCVSSGRMKMQLFFDCH